MDATRANYYGASHMHLNPIQGADDLNVALARIQQLWGAMQGAPGGDELDVLADMVGRYEAEYFPLPASDPIEAVRFRLEQRL